MKRIKLLTIMIVLSINGLAVNFANAELISNPVLISSPFYSTTLPGSTETLVKHYVFECKIYCDKEGKNCKKDCVKVPGKH